MLRAAAMVGISVSSWWPLPSTICRRFFLGIPSSLYALDGVLFGALWGNLDKVRLHVPSCLQISKTLLGENEDGTPRRLPRWLDEEDSLEVTQNPF